MPHIQVKLWPGRSEAQKQAFADAVVQAAQQTLGASAAYITVGIEEVPADVWPRQVYKPEIADKLDVLYKKPGYGYSDEELKG